MTTIVVGTDDSPGGRRAVRWALDEARIRGAELVVVHAWIMPLVDALPEPWVFATPVGHTDDRMHERLAEEAGVLLDGVVAADGYTGLGLLLGSVSSQCVHHAPCPVAVVPGEPAGN